MKRSTSVGHAAESRDMLAKRGPKYGCFANPAKVWPVVKECYLESSKASFRETGVNVTNNGKVYLEYLIGQDHINNLFVEGKVEIWSTECEVLNTILIPCSVPSSMEL